MPYQRYLAEFLGTFFLTLVVWLSVVLAMPFPTPVMAALTLGIFVYILGSVSGAHFNPAITIALLSTAKIKPRDAVFYLVAQLAGAVVAMFIGAFLSQEISSISPEGGLLVGVGEAIGAFVLAFGVSAVTHKKVDPSVSGLVVGGCLFIGIYLAFPFGNAVLNPAVALGIGSFGAMYILGPIVGAVGGAWAYEKLFAGVMNQKPPAVRT